MAVNGNKSTKKDLYIGYVAMKVTKLEFEKNEEKGKSFVVATLSTDKKIDGEKKNITVKVSFFVEPKANVSEAKGKTQFADKFGRFQWVEDPDKKKNPNAKHQPEDTDYFIAAGSRMAGVGEEALTGFIAAFANVKKEDECRFDSWKKIATGDLKELTDILEAFEENEVGVLLGIKDGKYQAVYTGKFERGWSTDLKNLVSTVKKDANNKLFFGKSPFPLLEYTPTATASLGTDENLLEDDGDLETSLGDEALLENELEGDDLPF